MRHRHKSILLTGACISVILLLVALMLGACRNGGASAGEQTDIRETTGTVTEQGKEPAEQGTTDTEEILGGTEDEHTDSDPAVPSESVEEPTDSADPPRETDTEADDPTAPADTESPEPSVTQDGTMPKYILFEQYQVLSGTEQLAYFQSFPTPEDFFVWYNAAVADYKDRKPGVEIGPDGNVIVP